MKKIVRLTERDLNKLVRRIVNEDMESSLDSDKRKWLSVKNRIPANPPKMSIGLLNERLGNGGYCTNNIEEPLANVKMFVYMAFADDNRVSNRDMLLIFDPMDKKWFELTK
jgi:hypothetical protein